MERRRFVILTLTGAAAVALPLTQCNSGAGINQPQFLFSLIGKDKTIETGKAYVERFPSEADRAKLTSLIAETFNKESHSSVNTRIQNEFGNGKVVIINGWILSVTEARQSALYYLNSLS